MIDIRDRSLRNGHFIGINQLGLLKQPLHFLAGGDVPLVRATIDPNPPLIIGVGPVQTVWRLDDHEQTLRRLDVE